MISNKVDRMLAVSFPLHRHRSVSFLGINETWLPPRLLWYGVRSEDKTRSLAIHFWVEGRKRDGDTLMCSWINSEHEEICPLKSLSTALPVHKGCSPGFQGSLHRKSTGSRKLKIAIPAVDNQPEEVPGTGRIARWEGEWRLFIGETGYGRILFL